jgi:hypothetical protein
MNVTHSFETLGTTYLVTQCHIPQDQNPQLHCCEILKTPRFPRIFWLENRGFLGWRGGGGVQCSLRTVLLLAHLTRYEWCCFVCVLLWHQYYLLQKRNHLCKTNSRLELVKLICGREILRFCKSPLIQSAWGCKAILNILFSVQLWWFRVMLLVILSVCHNADTVMNWEGTVLSAHFHLHVIKICHIHL